MPEEWQFVIIVTAPFGAVIATSLIGRFIKWSKMHDPIKVSYLIPKRDYRKALFDEAGDKEQTSEVLTVGVGI